MSITTFGHLHDLSVTCPQELVQVIYEYWAVERGKMAKRRHTPEEVINKVREAEAAIAKGSTTLWASGR